MSDGHQPPAVPRRRKGGLRVIVPAIVTAAIVLAAGGSLFLAFGSGGHGAKASPPTSSAPEAAFTSTSSTPPSPPVTTVASCASLVGQPTGSAIKASSATSISLGCMTGTSVATDKTQAGSQPCTMSTGTTTTEFYWATKDPAAADQHVYAGVPGGVILVVPNQSAGTFWTVAGGLERVAGATGCTPPAQ
jgi:hypothetical protein